MHQARLTKSLHLDQFAMFLHGVTITELAHLRPYTIKHFSFLFLFLFFPFGEQSGNTCTHCEDMRTSSILFPSVLFQWPMGQKSYISTRKSYISEQLAY